MRWVALKGMTNGENTAKRIRDFPGIAGKPNKLALFRECYFLISSKNRIGRFLLNYIYSIQLLKKNLNTSATLHLNSFIVM